MHLIYHVNSDTVVNLFSEYDYDYITIPSSATHGPCSIDQALACLGYVYMWAMFSIVA